MPSYSKEEQTRRKPKPKRKNGYAEATERARTKQGYLRCENPGCGRSLLDGQEHRHHVKHRSQGGSNEASNLAVICGECHLKAHNIRPGGTKDR